MTDDGVGVRVVQCLCVKLCLPSRVTVLDGGTLGLDLLPFLEGLERLLIVDAMETGGPPGTIARLTGDDIPIAFETKLSPHQMGLKDLLAVSLLQGNATARDGSARRPAGMQFSWDWICLQPWRQSCKPLWKCPCESWKRGESCLKRAHSASSI